MLTFLFVKFISLALLSVRSLVLASLLGPKAFGVLGTLVLLQQYLSYSAMGMREGVTVALARSAGAQDEIRRLHASSLVWAGCVGGFVCLVLICAGQVGFGPYGRYLSLVGAVSLLAIPNDIFININRDQNNLRKVAAIEVAYNAAPLLVALFLWRSVSIPAVLLAMVGGLAASVGAYAWTLPGASWRYAQWATIRKLMAIGFPLAVLSAITLLINSVFVVLGSWMGLGDELGRVVFATNACTLVLFGVNTVAWAWTSRSMRGLYHGHSHRDERKRTDRVRTVFHIGVVAAAAGCLASAPIFHVVMKSYAGSEVYAFYFCMFQSQSLLLFDEINYLAVTGRSRLIIGAYCIVLAVVVGASLLRPHPSLVALATIGIAMNCLLAAVAFHCCTALREGLLRDLWRGTFLVFPIAIVLAYGALGRPLAFSTCVIFVICEVWFSRKADAA